MRRAIIILAGAVAVAALAGGAVAVKQGSAADPTGFVAVKTTFPVGSSDAFQLGATALTALGRGPSADATVAERPGPTKLQLRRAGQVFDLCEVTVRPNRITTVTVVATNNRMACRIEA